MLGSSQEGEHSGTAGDAVDVLDAKGRTPLHTCAVRDSAGVAKVLIEYSASLHALCDPPEAEDDIDLEADASMASMASASQRSGLRTALHLAAYHDSEEVVQLLVDARANVASCVKRGHGALTPLHECATTDAARAARILAPLAAELRKSSTLPIAAAAVATEGADVGLDPMQTDESGAPEEPEWSFFLDPLHAKVGQHGSTPLHYAAENDAAGVAAALLAARADPSVGDDQNDTAVHCAILYGSPKVLEVLLAAGASPMAENGSGELPLHLAAEFGPGGVDEALPPALERRHFARSMKALDVLLAAHRVQGTLPDAVAHRADGDLRNTPLHAAARWDHLGALHAVRQLASARADLEARNGEDRTPLAVAMRRYGPDGKVPRLLRELGAQPPPAETVADFARALGGCVRPLVRPFAEPDGAQCTQSDVADMEVEPSSGNSRT